MNPLYRPMKADAVNAAGVIASHSTENRPPASQREFDLIMSFLALAKEPLDVDTFPADPPVNLSDPKEVTDDAWKAARRFHEWVNHYETMLVMYENAQTEAEKHRIKNTMTDDYIGMAQAARALELYHGFFHKKVTGGGFPPSGIPEYIDEIKSLLMEIKEMVQEVLRRG